MTNPHNDERHNVVSFLKHNQPLVPQAGANIEQNLIDALQPHSIPKYQQYLNNVSGFAKAISPNTPLKFIATGFLFTCVSLNLKTSRIAVEPKDLENLLVGSWHHTFNKRTHEAVKETEAYLFLPTTAEQPALSVAAP